VVAHLHEGMKDDTKSINHFLQQLKEMPAL